MVKMQQKTKNIQKVVEAATRVYYWGIWIVFLFLIIYFYSFMIKYLDNSRNLSDYDNFWDIFIIDNLIFIITVDLPKLQYKNSIKFKKKMS